MQPCQQHKLELYLSLTRGSNRNGNSNENTNNLLFIWDYFWESFNFIL